MGTDYKHRGSVLPTLGVFGVCRCLKTQVSFEPFFQMANYATRKRQYKKTPYNGVRGRAAYRSYRGRRTRLKNVSAARTDAMRRRQEAKEDAAIHEVVLGRNRVRTPLPNVVKADLSFNQVLNFPVTGGYKVYRANGMYDPDYSSSGHQPYGFDQLMAVYTSYMVIGSKLDVWADTVPDGSVPMSLILSMFADVAYGSVSAVSLQQAMERQDSTVRILGSNTTCESVTSPGFSIKKSFRVTSPMQDGSLQGTHTTDPIRPAALVISVAPLTGSPSGPGITMSVTLKQTALFFNKTFPGPS